MCDKKEQPFLTNEGHEAYYRKDFSLKIDIYTKRLWLLIGINVVYLTAI